MRTGARGDAPPLGCDLDDRPLGVAEVEVGNLIVAAEAFVHRSPLAVVEGLTLEHLEGVR
jgi:hypothetical protein